jgi:hypothetical protein
LEKNRIMDTYGLFNYVNWYILLHHKEKFYLINNKKSFTYNNIYDIILIMLAI